MSTETAVIVGGTSGMGLEAAKLLAADGLEVVVTGRDEEKAARVGRESPAIKAEAVDAASPVALNAFYRSVEKLDHLILCVSGAKGAGDFASLSESDLREGMDQKFFAQFRAAQLALPFLNKQGSLTFVSAISARAANPGTAGLAAINAAIEGMIKPMARELRPLRVNAMSPGVVETTWWDRLSPEVRGPILRRSAEATLVNRNGTPAELGEAIRFVVRNRFVNGTVLEVDGGLRLS